LLDYIKNKRFIAKRFTKIKKDEKASLFCKQLQVVYLPLQDGKKQQKKTHNYWSI